MAYTATKTRYTPVGAVVESTYGTNPGVTGSTDGITVYDSSAPVQVAMSVGDAGAPQGGSFTRHKSALGSRIATASFAWPWCAPNVMTGTPVLAGFEGIDALMQAAGQSSTSVTDTSTTYAPDAVSAITSASIEVELDGLKHTLTGAYGAYSLTGSVNGFVNCRYDATGIYNEPTIGTIGSFDGGHLKPSPFTNTTVTLANSSDTYVPAMDSFAFTRGTSVQRVEDANSASGTQRVCMTDATATLSVTIATDKQASDTDIITYPEFFNNWTADATHSVSIAWGSGAGFVTTLAVPTAQIVGIRTGAKNGYNTMTINYKVQHATEETEYSLAVT